MKRGETKTFSYTSTTSTDQEVIIYYASQVKALDNLSNLNPSSCILAPATKLTNVEIHSPELYNINVTNNKFLRTINLQDCTTLGTVTATGSSLDLSNCKYLRYCNVYNTALTEVQLNTSGGSLTEIYYPKTLQSLTLIKQRLLETIGLPYGDNGEEVPTSLYNVDIEECPKITRFNTSADDAISKSFASIYYCNNLTLKNTLDLESLTFDGFTRLTNVTIENMHKLQSVQFNNLLRVGDKATLKYVGFSNCPLLETIELNCTSNDFEIAFAQNSTLNLGGLSSLRTVESNCVIKGLGYLVVPLKLENMFFTNEYGEGFSELKNIWSSAVCTVSITGSTITTQHVIDGFEGIDFAGMNLKNIDLGALVNVPQAINFNLSPTTVNPNFNKNRDGVTYPYLQPIGTLDLSNYTESLARFFDGVDLRQLQLVCSNKLPQTDLSYCFYNSTFDKDTQISAVLNNISTVTNMDHCFYKTSVKDVSILNKINFLAGTSLSYCFAECPNITKLENITLSGNIGDASYMFSGCGVSVINNVSTSCGNIVGMFSNCPNLVTVTNFDANGTTSYESLFEGCSGMSVAPLTSIPGTITNISKMYKNCDGLVSIDGFVLHGNITNASELVAGCDNLINANNVTISGAFYNDIFRGITSLKYVNNLLINYVGRSMTFANMFDGCTNLIEMSFHNDSYVRDVISMDYMFRGTSMKTVDFSNVNFEKIVSYKYMFADCLMEEFSFTVPKTITSIQGLLSNCRNLKTLKNFTVSHNVTVTDWLLDTPIENLINCSFYNQNTSFKNNTTLKKIQGFNYTGNNLSNYFEGCSNLQSAELTIGSGVSKANNLFASCPLLTIVDFNTESDLSNVTTISDMFNGDSSLTTIKNLKITNPSTIANNTTLKDCPINNTDGLYINSNSAIQMFRMGTESKITQFTDFELGTSCDNLFEAFKDYPLLVKDIYLPSHVANVSYAFSNCTSMLNIVSNWTNSYDRNNDDDLSNDVITEGCYEDSNNIKYIDNELYMNEYGELTAMNYIPEEWGGNASYEDNQTVFDVKITEDNLTYTMLGNVGEYKTNWGDGTEDMNISHEYSKPGTYTIITENTSTFGQGIVVDSSISSPIVKFRALNKSLTNGSHLFDGWSNLLKVNKLTNTFNSCDYMFNNCSKLIDVDLSGCTLSQNVTTMTYMCNGCSKFTKTPISIIPDTCTNISYIFANSGIIDISGMTFGSGISNATSWIPPKLTTANNVTIKNNATNFNECKTLVTAKNFKFDGTNCDRMFRQCSKLVDVSGLVLTQPLYMGSVSNGYGMFAGCAAIEIVDFSNSDLSKVMNINNLFQYCNKLKEVIGLRIASTINLNHFSRIFTKDGSVGVKLTNFILEKNGFKFSKEPNRYESVIGELDGVTIANNVTDISGLLEGSCFLINDFEIPSHITNCTNTFKGCTSMTHVHSNWKNTYTNAITSTGCYEGCTGITHIDDIDIGVNEYHCGLDEIPKAWGGYEFTKEYTGIYKITVPSDNYVWSVYKNDDDGNTWALIGNKIIDWGDGNVTTGIGTHTYAKAGNYIIKGNTRLSRPGYGTHSQVGSSLTEVIQFPTSVTALHEFYNCPLLTKVNVSGCTLSGNCFRWSSAITEINLTNATFTGDVGGMFWRCSSLGNEGLIGWDTVTFDDTITNLKDFFREMAITSIDISAMQRLQPTTIESMFQGCPNLTTIIGLDKLNTSKVSNMYGVFNGCNSLVTLDLSSWVVDNVQNMGNMFSQCQSLTTLIGLENWNVSKVTNMANMFNWCENLVRVDFLTNWNVNNVTSIGSMFNCCKKLTEVNFNPDTYMANYGGSLGATFNECCELTRVTGLKLNPNAIYSSQNSLNAFIGKSYKIRYIENMYFGGSNSTAYNIFAYSSRGAIPDNSVTFVWDENSIFKGFNTSIHSSISINYETLLRICTPESRQSFAENVYDRVSNGLDTITVNNLGSAYLNEEQIALITSKGYTLVN